MKEQVKLRILTLEPFSGVRLDPRGPKRVIFLLSVRYICLQFLLRNNGLEVHMSIGVQTDPRKRVTSVILKTVIGLIYV